MKTRFAIVAFLASLSAAPLFAQVVYEPVRYQYGRYNEVFYGGQNPGFTSNSFVYLPPALLNAYAAQRLDTPPGINAYMPYGPGSPFFSPYNQSSVNSSPIYTPYVFSDSLPYLEAGQFGFTPDDARNEAYANVPLYQGPIVPAGPISLSAPPAPSPSAAPTSASISPRDKAIPLLDWAKVERTRNPNLYNALLNEARKLDPDATAALERSVASER